MEYEIVDKYGNMIIDYFNSEAFRQLIATINTVLIIYSIIFTISFIASLFMLYKKENIAPYKAFIPIYNLYDYFKLIDMKYYLVFIPFINLVTIYLSIYNVAKAHRCEKYIKVLAIFIPFIIFPYIVFSGKYSIPHKQKVKYLKTVEDVDKLEDKLTIESMSDVLIENRSSGDNTIDNSYKSSIDQKIETIENNAIQDNSFEDYFEITDEIDKNEKPDLKATDKTQEEEILIDDVNIQDLFDSNDIRVNSIETLDDKIEESSRKEIIDNAEYKEYQTAEVSASTIAFGGIDKNDKVKEFTAGSKDNNLRCPYCNAELNSSSATCPNCSKDVSQYVFEK